MRIPSLEGVRYFTLTIAPLVDPAALDKDLLSENLLEGTAQGFGAVDDGEETIIRIKPAVN